MQQNGSDGSNAVKRRPSGLCPVANRGLKGSWNDRHSNHSDRITAYNHISRFAIKISTFWSYSRPLSNLTIRLRVARSAISPRPISRYRSRAERERLSSFLGSLLPVTFSSPPLSGLALVWLLLYPVVRSVSVCCCCRRARSLSVCV